MPATAAARCTTLAADPHAGHATALPANAFPQYNIRYCLPGLLLPMRYCLPCLLLPALRATAYRPTS